MSKQSFERLEYLRNYRKNHKEQQRKYQKKYIDKLRQQGKYPISVSMKLRNEIQELEQELQRKDDETKQLQEDIKNHIKIASEYKEQMIIKDNIINELKYGIQKIRDLFYEKCRIRNENGYYSMNNSDLQDFYDILDKIKELEESK